MADVNVTDLTQETYSTLDGTEQVIMFDSAEGKRATVAAVGEYVLKKLTTSLNGSTQTVANALSSLNSDLKNRIRNIESGSIFDVVDSGLYYVTNAVTGKPSGLTGNTRGALIVIEFDNPNINYIQYVYLQGDTSTQTIWICLALNGTSYGWKQVTLAS